MRPSIDHSLLSPSGRISKSALRRAKQREGARLFPPGFWVQSKRTPEQQHRSQIVALQQHAERLRDLARHGMNTRAYRREADKVDVQIKNLKEADR